MAMKVRPMHTLTLALSGWVLAVAAPIALATTVSASNVHGHSSVHGKARTDGFTAMPHKKGGSGVDMVYRIEGTPSVGNPLDIRIRISSRVAATTTLRAGAGLLLSDPAQVLRSHAGQPTEHTVSVVPQSEGRFYLNLFSVANGRGGASAIAVQVGKGSVQLKPAGKVQVMPDGERVISVPAQ